MIFSSLLFLILFLPVFLLFYFGMPDRNKQNAVLLIFSLLFYCWGGITYLLLLIIMTAVGFIAGKLLQYNSSASSRKGILIGSVALFLAVLAVFKYTGFFLGSLGSLLHKDLNIVNIALPMGISFYTFKLISYVSDVYHERTKACSSYFKLLLYTSIFHQSMSGPIERYTDMSPEIDKRKATLTGLVNGMTRFCTGLAKKAVLANHCGSLADSFLPMTSEISSVPAVGVWLGSLCYMLQIYLDFSAYSDMALGLGQMIGFHYKENFMYPYIAVSVKDFWRRWHISLSSFFRDYVYIPLGGNRCSQKRLILNLLIVWGLTGLWHGASWNFVLWGLFYFVFIVLENYRNKQGWKPLPAVFGHIYTLLVVYFGWILFRFENFGQLGLALKGMFCLNRNSIASTAVGVLVKNNIFFLILSVLTCTPLFVHLGQVTVRTLNKTVTGISKAMILRILLCILMLAVSICALIGNSYTPFLYNQF